MVINNEVALIIFVIIEIAIFAALRYFSVASSTHREEVAKLRYEIGRLRMLLVSMNEKHKAEMDNVHKDDGEEDPHDPYFWDDKDPPF